MKPIESLYDIDWNPRILIEASAGTGKTYTLTALYIRLLVEKELEVDQILVMTFTKKATAELKERIFKRLKECLSSLESGTESKDTFVKKFLEQVQNRNEAAQRLRVAIQNFDDSQVFTIHGFCQKILNEEALLAGTPFDFEVVQQDEMLTQAVEDFWRNFMNRYSDTEAGKYYISKLLDIADSPSKLRDQLSAIFSKPYATLEGEGVNDPVGYLQDLLKIRHDIVQAWNADQAIIRKELLNCDLKYYTEKNVSSRIREMQKFVDDISFSMDTFDQLKFFTSGYIRDPENLKSGKSRVPNHSIFEICEEYFELVREIDKVKTTLIQEAVEEIFKRREKLSINSNTITYDDLLNRVERALIGPGELSETLQKKYPAALVDEFQDTDPIQYSILNSIYPSEKTDSSLVMIGDPKQAIYAFRGADVHTYIQAKNETGVKQYTLHKNFRSTPSYNRAVNALFGNSEHSFVEKGIDYVKVDSGLPELEDQFLLDGHSGSGIRFITKPGIDSNKEDANRFVFSQTVKKISGLLRAAEKGAVRIKDRKLEAGDIAVLVSSHRHAEEVKRRLKTVGIDSVTYSREKVFESAEARRLESVMTAILDPYNRIAVNNALVSGFWGQNLNKIYEFSIEGNSRQLLLDELQELGEVWSRDGFYPMFRKLLFSDEKITKLGQFSNSERILTNLYQLADISAKAEKEGKLDPQALYSWFVDEMVDPDKDDEKTLLLESDQNLVKISTIHNSKGLEFPVVFCPTLWDVKSGNNNKLLTEYHTEKGDPVIRYDQQPGEEKDAAAYRSNLENTAEEIRKYYVAVTRAKYLCVIPWANHSASLQSGLASSLIGSESVKDVIRNNIKLKEETEFTDQTLLGMFKKLEQESDGSIKVYIKEDEEQEGRLKDGLSRPKELKANSYKGRPVLEVQRRVESFSSLAHHHTEPGEPDYDQVMESYLSAINQEREEVRELNIFTFPRGATAGTAIHKLFEDQNFRFDTALEENHESIIEKVLDQYQIDPKWKPVVQDMIRNVISADIPGLNLSDVEKSEELREMEFHFKAKQPSLENILGIIRSEGEQGKVSGQDLKSFLTGFIDLIVRQNGKYYIVDYKSNYLGDSLEDYSRDHLKEEIYNASYDLQYHLYTVALVKYLKLRMKEFNYERDFGGVAYLFVRGMREGKADGVWFHTPDKSVIQDLINELEAQ